MAGTIDQRISDQFASLHSRGIPTHRIDESPLAGRTAYAFVSLFALAIASGCLSQLAISFVRCIERLLTITRSQNTTLEPSTVCPVTFDPNLSTCRISLGNKFCIFDNSVTARIRRFGRSPMHGIHSFMPSLLCRR